MTVCLKIVYKSRYGSLLLFSVTPCLCVFSKFYSAVMKRKGEMNDEILFKSFTHFYDLWCDNG